MMLQLAHLTQTDETYYTYISRLKYCSTSSLQLVMSSCIKKSQNRTMLLIKSGNVLSFNPSSTSSSHHEEEDNYCILICTAVAVVAAHRIVEAAAVHTPQSAHRSFDYLVRRCYRVHTCSSAAAGRRPSAQHPPCMRPLARVAGWRPSCHCPTARDRRTGPRSVATPAHA